MPKVKPVSEAKDNYRASASLVPDRYKAGIARADWKSGAESAEAEELYAVRMQEVIANKSRQKGVSRVSNSQWRARAEGKGATQIGQAMRESVDKWATNTAPFFEAIEAVNLPPRSSDPMSNIDRRVKPIVQALIDKKKQING